MQGEILDLGCHAEASVRGDEMALILGCTPSRGTGKEKDDAFELKLRRCTRLALQVAIRLKRRWLLETPNRTRIHQRQPPLGVAIGIHAGPVVVGQHIRFLDTARPLSASPIISAEGYAVNTAKRVETASRTGRFSRIFLTRPIFNRTPADFRQAFVRFEVPELKGIPVSPIIYEAKGIGHFDDKSFPKSPEFEDNNLSLYESVVSANPDELWLVLDLAHKYFDIGDYDKAARKYKLAIESDPEFSPAYAYLGRAYLRNYLFQEAHAALERATDLDRGQARSNHFFAVCLRREALFEENKHHHSSRERDLLQRAINYHDRACRIAELEGMDFPWARNGLNWTIGQCEGITDISLPYDINEAFSSSEHLHDAVSRSDEWRAKAHLVLDAMAFIRFKQQQYGPASDLFNRALASLDGRLNDAAIAPDRKGYAERKAEILYYMGVCDFRMGGHDALPHAKQRWKDAYAEILNAWGT
jgi:tetratricopeptide (TPR) repeat protein